MSWSKYAEFLGFAVLLILIPGPDFTVVTKNTLTGGRLAGTWTAIGIFSSNFTQGTAAAAGLSALIMRSQPVFEAIKWAGVAYLAYLGGQAIRSAIRGEYRGLAEPDRTAAAVSGWRQGFLSNITNPKVLVFYLAVLPQFLTPGATVAWVLAFAWTHALLGVAYLLVLVKFLHAIRGLLMRRQVRRGLDATTGTVLIGFSARLAAEHV